MSKKKKELKKLESKLLLLFKKAPQTYFNYKQIAALLKVNDTKGRNNIIRILHLLDHKNIIKAEQRGKYRLNKKRIQSQEAKIKILPTGKGVIKLNDTDDEIIIPRKALNTALDGDLVEVSLLRSKKKTEAHVIQINKRATNHYVGILERQKEFGFVNCKNHKCYTDFFIEKEDLKTYKDGEKVVVQFKSWTDHNDAPHGKIIKSLGKPGETDTEIHAILHDYNLPYEFPYEVEQIASQIPQTISPKEIEKRKDFREVLTFTIDPKTAKDFDDALSFRVLPKGFIEVGIHIADVSYYVQPDTLLDKEAYERATSVYLVDRVVPMLPETLSNSLCSLRPKEEKLTFSAVFTLNQKGAVIKEWYGRTVIFSDYRFAYEEVQDLLEQNKPHVSAKSSLNGEAYSVNEEVFHALTTLNKYAQQLRQERMRKGALSFDRVEVNFHLDKENKPDGVFFKSSKEANKLIEEFMLLANRKVASYIAKQENKRPFVYRVHDVPDEQKLEQLKRTVNKFGYQFNLSNKNKSNEINKLLISCQGKNEQNLIDTLTLRCMSKAEYTTQNIGHYGLAFDYYTHFTSPIRRYPDILVHRLLAGFLANEKQGSETVLEEACIHSSQKEQLATKAERDSIKYMQLIFMEDKIGEQFDGVISGVTERGLYVELLANKCEGMIRNTDLNEDYFYYDLDQHALIGETTQKKYQLGDTIRIKVKKVNILKRFLDFIPIQ